MIKNFTNTGIDGSNITFQVKSLSYPNDIHNIMPGDYIEIAARVRYRQSIDIIAGTPHTYTDDPGEHHDLIHDNIVLDATPDITLDEQLYKVYLLPQTALEGKQMTSFDICNLVNEYIKTDGFENAFAANYETGTQISAFYFHTFKYGNEQIDHSVYPGGLNHNSLIEESTFINKHNIHNLFRNGQLEVDGSSGKLKFAVEQKNVVVSPVWGTRVVKQEVLATQLTPAEFSDSPTETFYSPGVIPSGVFYTDQLNQQGIVEHDVKSSIVDFSLSIRAGSGLGDKRREILSRILGLRPKQANFETDPDWALPFVEFGDNTVGRKLDLAWHTTTNKLTGYEYGVYESSSPYVSDVHPYKQVFVHSNLESNIWKIDGQRSTEIFIGYLKDDMQDLSENYVNPTSTYEIKEEITSLKNLELEFKDKWGDLFENNSYWTMELAIFY